MPHPLAAALLAAMLLFTASAGADPLPVVHPPVSPTAEFEAPYALGIVAGGEMIEISGSFSRAMPQNLVAMLGRAPRVRTIRFDSPGGHVEPAMQIADIIRSRGLDTYVPRVCASACTVAFLAGKSRFLDTDARMGFHQARAPGVPPAYFDPALRGAYSKSGVPTAFIDHVLRTPPAALWYPTQAELRAAGLVTGPLPVTVPLEISREQALRVLFPGG